MVRRLTLLAALTGVLWSPINAFAQFGPGPGPPPSSGSGSCSVGSTANQLVINNGSGGCTNSSATLTTGGAFSTGSTVSASGAIAGGSTITAGSSLNAGTSVFLNGNGGVVQWSSRETLSSPSAGGNLIQEGPADSAGPTSNIFGFSNAAISANIAGADNYIRGSLSTGSGVGGALRFQTSLATAASTTQNAGTDVLVIDGKQHATFTGPTLPSVSACGTSPGTPNGSDSVGHVLSGTGVPTSCTITFAKAYAATPKPVCDVWDDTARVNVSSVAYTGSAGAWTGFTITNTAASSQDFNWHCFGL